MPLRVEHTDHVVTAAVNRPGARNAVNFELMDRLEELVTQLSGNSNVRLFILTGSNNSFISGGDLREFHQLKSADDAKKMTRRMLRLLDKIRQLPFWTMAALNGDTYGGGWEIAATFDFRVAKRDINIGFTQGKFYLPPGWGGVASLTKLIPKKKALYWLATQRVISADEAYQSGFADELLDEDTYPASLQAIIDRLTRNDRPFIEYLKKSAQFDNPTQEVEPFSTFWESDEHRDRVQAFLDRKKS
ncbi:enoyl-CoA hydratase/isomerase family protein [Rhodohalobacter sp. 8-1]|uniref:enoyl-CoA hydratase/isomerase family protein n=1 Tax=Rhodohalobacter sp. 8-1 TaxID=3131972 RepID=UPI0030EB1C79